MTQPQPQPQPSRQPETGATVITPSGASAKIVEVYDGIGEALIEWESGERAQFKIGQLKAAPR